MTSPSFSTREFESHAGVSDSEKAKKFTLTNTLNIIRPALHRISLKKSNQRDNNRATKRCNRLFVRQMQ